MLGDYALIEDVIKSFDRSALQRLKVIELKALCREKGLKLSGVKAILIQRLITGQNEDE